MDRLRSSWLRPLVSTQPSTRRVIFDAVPPKWNPERQQMRQRGAGTRKAKEIDFGFSFGSPTLGLSAPAPLATVPEAQNPPRTQTAPNTTPRSLKVPQPESQARGTERTPGSARNKLPERPSAYEVPSSDDRAGQTRSNKRRKISPPDVTEDTPSRRNGGRPENGDAHPVEHSAGSTESQASLTQAPPNTDAPPLSEIMNNESSQPLISPIPETSVQDQQPIEEETHGVEPTTSAAEEPLAQGTSLVPVRTVPPVDEESQSPLSSPEAQAGVKQPENTEQLREKRHNTRSPPRPEERIQINKNTETASPVQTGISATKALSPRGTSAEEALEANHAPTTDDVDMTEHVPPSKDDAPEQDNRTSQGPSTKTKKPRGRPRHQPTTNTTPELNVEAAVQGPATEAQDEPAAAQVEETPKTKRPRGRPSLNKKTIEAIETEHISPEATPDVAESLSRPRRGRKPTSPKDDQPETVVESAVPKPRGRPGKKAKHAVEPEPEPEPVAADQAEQKTESALSKPQRSKSGKKAKRAAETGPEPEPEPEAESVVPKPRGRPGKKNKHAAEPEPEPEPEDQPEPEVESAVSKPQRGRPGKKANRAIEPEPEPEPVAEEQPQPEAESAAPKAQRGRPGKKSKRAVAPEPESEPEPETEYQPEPETTQEQPRRKTREPRGETVPVTVYRLANVNSLGGTASMADGSGDEEESADELTTHQRAKIPNRGGVNPADVLSQICRETLEKTLNTLKDGIANEANATRRAEWSRKRKAVEVFGSELESRLMDLSGILDSNFVLGVQLKKAKREMMDLRNHLYRVRRERENIALQMDAVRSRHIEGEKAKSSRSAISNSLHSLELALYRNKQRSASAGSSTDLEYMLRTVADVSSRAPGAQGGLLNQIRAFNAQLEATVGRLEL
ncbi:unnamed protein product [Penicillium nalgiovense]|uniref:Inner kinetochore subunit AME1 domain-containing protein n=1 Tax=Penicillium nalgiovense TaxID=60175 RepID=A0A9W4HH08_PENNA|nr:unnamed protein product [Penicillium nalgiovense]CAG7958289.1 unnamed protein product [Penicillium nalgiovense]CAG7976760.1 unnamed protein product [Penicillium nalgiovense]CAG7976946.1 unnamed protein product [Penicillium nalgiovense]CAG7978630.1 unnamed protein product [Penicillium nalgiovense]